MSTPQTHAGVIDELHRRIALLVPQHPEILEFRNAFKLGTVPAYKAVAAELMPSYAQATAALARVKVTHRRKMWPVVP